MRFDSDSDCTQSSRLRAAHSSLWQNILEIGLLGELWPQRESRCGEPSLLHPFFLGNRTSSRTLVIPRSYCYSQTDTRRLFVIKCNLFLLRECPGGQKQPSHSPCVRSALWPHRCPGQYAESADSSLPSPLPLSLSDPACHKWGWGPHMDRSRPTESLHSSQCLYGFGTNSNLGIVNIALGI